MLMTTPPLSSSDLPGAEDLPALVDARSLEAGLQQAAAVARLLLSSDSVITNAREDEWGREE
jgi:ABC-type transport system involved in cytochrome c biogenesis ATPase subunit